MTTLKTVLLLFSILSLVAVMMPLIRKDLWVYRIFDYPRLQKIVIIAFLLAVWISLYRDSESWFELILMACLLLSFLFLGYQIIPFSPLGRTMIKKSKNEDGRITLDVLVSNVYQYNIKYHKLLNLVNKRNPDVIFLLETDGKWADAVKELRTDYPHFIEIPKDNTYGLLFYSRLPISNQQINYLIESDIPSIIVDVEFDNQNVRIYGLHPAPPVPQESKHSTERDAEILLIGKLAKEYNGPCMVIGDLNDVAWSYTTKLFLKISSLLDPRHGRGLYSTFHAKYSLLRWPLDHFFVSTDFHLVQMEVEEFIGSDHFPISICLVLTEKDDSNPIESDHEDEKLAADKIKAGITHEPR